MSDEEPSSNASRLRPSARPTRASDRAGAQRKKSGRMFRTILLGTIAMVAGVLWLGDQYGVDREETLSLLGASAGFVLILAFAGLVGAGIISLIRWLSRASKQQSEDRP